VAVSGFPTHRAGGRVDGAVVMVEDRTGERIEERERRLRSLRDLAARVGGELRDFLRDLKETAPAAALDGAPEGRWLERRLRHLDDVASGLAAFSGRGVEAAAGVKTGAEEVLEGVLAAPGNGVFLPEGTAARSKIRIDYRLGPGLWPVAMGERALADAITEVLRNACEAMPDGGSLTVRAANLRLEETGGALPPGAYVEVQVKDTGGGIDPSQIERVLEPFYSTKPRDRSLGVGLSLAYGAVRAAGGDLRLESQPGKGTTVRILLPAAR
jgi:signal transduction histidine kinase